MNRDAGGVVVSCDVIEGEPELANANPHHDGKGRFASAEEAVAAVHDGKSQAEDFGEPTPEAIGAWKTIKGLNVAGFKHHIDAGEVRHAYSQHGEGREKRADQAPITRDDWLKVPEIIRAADRHENGGLTKRQGRPALRYVKDFPDGTRYYVEQYIKDNKKLSTQTMWKKKSATRGSAVTAVPST